MRILPSFLSVWCIVVLLTSCNQMKEYQEVSEETSDIHSLAQPKRAKMTHLALDLKVDFDRKQLVGTATIYFDNETGANQLILDTKDLDIQQVLLDDSTKANYSLGEEVALLGRPLRIQVAPNTKKVTIAYTSSPKSAALQWLTPAQTAGGEQPFLFSQSQCILARTWIPCQDGPGMRFTYQARVEVPPHLMALMSALLGYQDLLETIEQKGKNNKDTKLLLDLRKRDPDEAVSDIAYEKGYFFLRLIEESIGREKFDRFLRKYFETFAFESMNTQRFINYLEKEIIKDDEVLAKKINYKDWIYGTGLPQNCPKVTSKRFTQVDAQLQLWKETQSTDSLNTADWSTQEWLHFIRQLPVQMDIEQMKQLDEAYEFTASGNTEIQAAWYVHAIEHQYEAAYEAIENFLINIGRRKFLTPLYSALVKTEEVRTLAKDIYAKARPNYHYVAVNTLDEIVGYQSAK